MTIFGVKLFGRGPSAEMRVIGLAVFMLLGLGVLVAKLWWEQAARGPIWQAKIQKSSEVKVRIPAVRGEIRDRNGITLVSNRPSYEVDFYLPDMVRGYRKEYGNPPLIEFDQRVDQMLTRQKQADIVHVVNASVIPRLKDLSLAKDYSSKTLQRHFRNNTEVPFTYLEDIDFDTVAKFSENSVGLPGVEIAVTPVRNYVFGSMAAHILGYVGAPEDISKLNDLRAYTFYQADVEGKTQVEHFCDEWLRGKPGTRILHRDVKGMIEGEKKRIPPTPGLNVHLTLDARIQFIVERALRAVGRGAAVVVDPNNGDILAMASVPSYDPNWFIPSINEENWAKIEEDDTDPLLNRAIQGYAPGSTFKLVTALAGLRSGIAANKSYSCSGSVSYGGTAMRCWIASKGGSHGSLQLPDAIKHSCNCFFYQYGNAANISQIDAVGAELGLGKKTGLPLSGEDSGILPSPEWLRLTSPQERWSTGYTANTSIGQGSVEASPLQMAMVVATIANRGVSYFPRLVSRVVDATGADATDANGNLLVPPEPRIRANLRDVGMTEEQIEVVRDGMRRVVASGTGKKAQIKGVSVAGKTGTAQFWRTERVGNKKEEIKDNHTWFVSFAPYEAPKYAVCVFVQGAKSGGGVSAPIAQKIIEESLSLEKGYQPEIKRFDPAPGSFAQIEAVNFEKEVPSTITNQLAQGEDGADHTDEPPKKSKNGKGKGAKPTIRQGADQAGRVANVKAVPVNRKPNFFERLFGGKSKKEPARSPGR